MKTKLVIALFFFCAIHCMAQDENYFQKKIPYESGSTIIFSPTFEVSPAEKRGENGHYFKYRFEPKEIAYYKDKAREILLRCLTEEELDALVPSKANASVSSSSFLLYFNHNGKVIYIIYMINKQDVSILTEQKLYEIYQAWKHTRLDMTKGEFDYYTKKKSDRPDLEYTSLQLGFYMNKP